MCIVSLILTHYSQQLPVSYTYWFSLVEDIVAWFCMDRGPIHALLYIEREGERKRKRKKRVSCHQHIHALLKERKRFMHVIEDQLQGSFVFLTFFGQFYLLI